MLKQATRRAAALIMAGAIAVSLSGCYTMKTENVYHADGTLDSTILIAMDEAVLAEQLPDSSDPGQDFMDSTMGSTDMQALQEQLGDRLSVERYAANGEAGVLMTMTDVTANEVARVNSSQAAPAGDTTITHADGKITLDYTADAELMANYDDALSSLAGVGIDSSALSTYIDFEARHTFPGPVASTTIGTIDPENPNSVIITDLTEVNGAQHYTIVASDGSSGVNTMLVVGIVIAVLLVLLAGGGIIIGRVLASRKASAAATDGTDETQLQGDDAAEGSVGTISPEEVKE